MESTTLSGGCLCGAIRYKITQPPNSVAYCHCQICQRASGATTIAWAGLHPSAVTILQGQPAKFHSSPFAARSFCAQCGTQLFFQYYDHEEIDVTVGSLDDPGALAPTYHTWVKRRPRWLALHDDLPKHDEDGPDFNPNKDG